MKKLIFLLITVLITGVLSAQSSNTFKYLINAKGGINLTLKADTASKVDSMKIVNNKIGFYHGATPKDPLITDTISGSSIYAPKHITDTVYLTGSRAIPLTYDGQWISVVKATEARIYIPADSSVNFPLGTVINFSMDGAGIVHFIKGTGVYFRAVKDSVCINSQYGVVTAIKYAANRWRLFGTLTD